MVMYLVRVRDGLNSILFNHRLRRMSFAHPFARQDTLSLGL